MQYQKGQSGNPAGRLRGIRDRRTLLAEQLFEGDAQAIVRKAIELAKTGDTAALRMCLERICPNLKQRPLVFELPSIEKAADTAAAMAAITQGLAEGSLTAGEAADLAKVIQTFGQTLWDTNFAARLERVEEAIKKREAKGKT